MTENPTQPPTSRRTAAGPSSTTTSPGSAAAATSATPTPAGSAGSAPASPERFGVDPVLVRAAAVVLASSGASACTIYVLLWLRHARPPRRHPRRARVRHGDAGPIALLVLAGSSWSAACSRSARATAGSPRSGSSRSPSSRGSSSAATAVAAASSTPRPTAPRRRHARELPPCPPHDTSPPAGAVGAPRVDPGHHRPRRMPCRRRHADARSQPYGSQPGPHGSQPGTYGGRPRPPARPSAAAPGPVAPPPPPRPRRRPAERLVGLASLGIALVGLRSGRGPGRPDGLPRQLGRPRLPHRPHRRVARRPRPRVSGRRVRLQRLPRRALASCCSSPSAAASRVEMPGRRR